MARKVEVLVGGKIVKVKVWRTSDYPVAVYRQERAWLDLPREAATLYAGIFAVTLNHLVCVRFVPDVSDVAPPWDGHEMVSTDEIRTVERARLFAALDVEYVVTPNDALAGTEDRHSFVKTGVPELDVSDVDPDDDYDPRGVVFYVTTGEFDRYALDLHHLAERTHSLTTNAFSPVSELRNREVIGFLERRIVASPLLDPFDAEWLRGRPRRRWWG